ncbi:hypothetical protein [Pseudactinotalea sp. HY160]|uniref:hypothetical protein n=1 Tax=Pseudactinotalea sp. HY160 TaxID=2654490 RepID=UPI001883C134|nr:hypothetical protein [Pseudactinotalea sp. HY160]
MGDAPATDAAREDLCRPGKIVDGVRADGVAIIAMGLMTSEGQAATDDLDRNRLQAIAEGVAGTESCGTTPVPANVTNGAFLNAEDANALNRLFAQMGALLEGLTPGESFNCPDSDCVDGRLQIPVDPGVGGFRLVVEVDPGAPDLQLAAPDGTTTVLDSRVSSISGATTSLLESGSLQTVDVATSGGAEATGVWTLITDPSVTALVDLYYFWDVTLTVEAPAGVVIGESSPVTIVVRDAAGAPIDLSAYESADLVAGIDGIETIFAPTGEGWTADVAVPVDAAVTSMQVHGSVSAVTAPHGIELGPIRVERQLTTEFPPSFPTLAPAQLDLGRMEGSTSAEAVLTVTGAERGGTRVCFGAAELMAPAAAGSVSLAPDVDCADVDAGATVEIPVRLDVADVADGRVAGTLPVQLHGVDPGEPIAVDVPVTATMIRPINPTTALGLLLLLVLGALLCAWATAVVTRRWYGSYRLGRFAKYVSVPVTVGASGPRRRDDAPELVSPAEFRALSPSARGRLMEFTAGPVEHRVKFPIFPLAEPRALVRGAHGTAVPVTHNPRSTTDPAERLTDFPGSVGFVILTERPLAGAAPETIAGTLLLVIDPGDTSTVAQLLPDRLAELARVNWSAEVTRAHEAWEALSRPAGKQADLAAGSRTGADRRGRTPAAGNAPTPRDHTDPAAASAPPPPRSGPGAPPPRGATPASHDAAPPRTPARSDGDRPHPPPAQVPPPPPPRR